MRLNRLILEQYRNYSKMDLQIDPAQSITYIIGQNAQGKTNILEAIYLLALTKSFRTKNQQNLIQWDKEFSRVKGVFEAQNDTFELEVFIGNPPHPKRSLKKNGVKTSLYKFIGNCQMVFFHPEDLNILYLGPDLRRRYMDILNIQINPAYYNALRAYKRIMQQRNSLLKNIKDGFSAPQDLNVWDEQLIEQGSTIMEERQKTIDFINSHITGTYRKISENNEEIRLNYLSAYEKNDTVGDLYEHIKNSFKEKLQQSREKDLRAEFTTVGPHRDEIEFILNERPLASHASRGEYRSIILTLKLIELKYYEEKTGEKPLLLLDDVFSELDKKRQRMLLESIKGYQAILTSTTIDNMGLDREHGSIGKEKPLDSKQSLIKIENGNIIA
jgi:DNA replication and repair protein RecF